MTKTAYNVTMAEMFRLNTAFTAIRDPAIRAEFLRTIEAWAEDQWNMTDSGAYVKKAAESASHPRTHGLPR